MSNLIIIGGGPAGVSAALYTVRAGLDTTIIKNGIGALEKAHSIENYYGFALPVCGEALVTSGIEQARRIGAKIIDGEVISIGFDKKFVVKTTSNSFTADYVLLATGSPRSAPLIAGLSENEGKGVSYCAVCDAFFHKGKHVAVLGESEYALNEIYELLPIAGSITMLTNGKTPQIQIPNSVQLDTRQIEKIEQHEKGGLKIKFENGSILNVSALFVACGVAGSAELAKKIGVITNGNKIVVDATMKTNINGLYAAGDCIGGMLQINKATYDGAIAGTAIIRDARLK